MASTGSNSSVREPEVAAARTDIALVLTSYNDARTIGPAVRAMRDGLSRHVGSGSARFILVDAGSTDGTEDAARAAAAPSAPIDVARVGPPGLADIPYHGYPRRAAALRTALETAARLQAKACVFVDPGLLVPDAAWTERLLSPVLSGGFDYVSPYYVRRANEGALTRGIVYPMFRALYGVRLRQPAGHEFACSRQLVAYYLEQDFWEFDQADAGVDLWLATAAACGPFRACETALGARPPPSRDAPTDLGTTLAQVVGALYADLEHRVDVWQRVRGSVAVPLVGAVPTAEVEPVSASLEPLIESFRLGYRELREIWTWVLPPRTIVELRKLADGGAEAFRFDDRLWATIVYDFALGYTMRVMPRDHLLRSLAPIYSGWAASFLLQVGGATTVAVEDRVEQICRAFEAEKRYLISRWRWPERLR